MKNTGVGLSRRSFKIINFVLICMILVALVSIFEDSTRYCSNALWSWLNSALDFPISPTKNSSAVYKIPKRCFQTWYTKNLSTLSPTTLETMAQNQQHNADIVFELWDDNDVASFLQTEFTRDVYDAFQSINIEFGAARADFFRYCVLYKLGGLYLDIKSIMKEKKLFGDMILPNDMAVLDKRRELEFYRQDWKYGTYEQW